MILARLAVMLNLGPDGQQSRTIAFLMQRNDDELDRLLLMAKIGDGK